ncbi:MAG: phosphatase PAP2 family protein [Candidatus Asgardarchaeia archaeon]
MEEKEDYVTLENKNTWDYIAYLISIITSPQILTTLIIYYIILAYPMLFYPIPRRYPLAIATVFLLLIPGIAVAVKAFWGDIDLFIKKRQKRVFYFKVTSISYASGSLVSMLMNLKILLMYFLTFLVLTLLVFLINFFSKVSLHVSVATSALTFISAIINLSIPFALALILLIIWARLRTKAHTMFQIVIGLIIGFITPAITIEVIEHITLISKIF